MYLSVLSAPTPIVPVSNITPGMLQLPLLGASVNEKMFSAEKIPVVETFRNGAQILAVYLLHAHFECTRHATLAVQKKFLNN